MNLKLLLFTAKGLNAGQDSGTFLKFSKFAAFTGVMLGSMALIISLSILAGFEDGLRENVYRFTANITAAGRDRVNLPLSNETQKEFKDRFDDIKSISPLVEKECLIKSASATEGILLRGIEADNYHSDIGTKTVSGDFFSAVSSGKAVIGKKLADKLSVGTGDKVTVLSVAESATGGDLTPDAAKFECGAIYETGMAKYDESAVFVGAETARKLFKIEKNTVTGYEIRLKHPENSREIAKAMNVYYGAPFYFMAAEDVHAALFSWIDLQKEPIPIVLGLISLVAVFNIVTALLLLIVEKTHTIGILRTAGMSGGGIMAIFLYRGLSVTASGSFIGCLAGLLFGLIQKNFGLIRLSGDMYFLDKLPISIVPEHYAIVFLSAVLLGLPASLVPAMISSKISPVKAVRFK